MGNTLWHICFNPGNRMITPPQEATGDFMSKDTPSPTPPQTSAQSANKGGGAVAPCPCDNAKIISETIATIPGNRARTRLGVGERTKLTYSLGSAAWTLKGSGPPDELGSLSGNSGESVSYDAPERAISVTITATGKGCTATIDFKIVEPSEVRLSRRPGTKGRHYINKPSTGLIADVYLFPADVSFENCRFREDEAYAAGTGCFKEYFEQNKIGHQPNPSAESIGPPISDTSGSVVKIYDKVSANATQACAGGWRWAIDCYFQVGGGGEKKFTTVMQVVEVSASGTMKIAKAGADNESALNAPNDVDPLF
jgi:hypothetical protein